MNIYLGVFFAGLLTIIVAPIILSIPTICSFTIMSLASLFNKNLRLVAFFALGCLYSQACGNYYIRQVKQIMVLPAVITKSVHIVSLANPYSLKKKYRSNIKQKI